MGDWAIFASDPGQSRGRLFNADASPTRSEFQRDRDRIIHSTAFRRLQHKTQVFLHHEGQHFRTRLTHTLEVSQIARSVARALRVNEDLAEAIALAHDLGHTPFGHAGERVLDAKMAEWGGFDHNLQALRTVTKLENRYAAHDGLNLTWESLEGILKHNGPLPEEEAAMVETYAGDALPADIAFDTHAGLEAQIAAIADDIAYNSHDIDDAVRAGLLKLSELVDVPLVGPIASEVLGRWPDIEPARQTHEVQRRLITRMIEDVIRTSTEAVEALDPSSVDDVRDAGRTLITFSAPLLVDEKALKDFLFDHVYRAEPVYAHVQRSEEVVAAIFDHLMDTADMPGRWGEAAQSASSEAARARIVCDFVAGMTDPYALDLYQRVFDDRPDFR